MENLENQPEVEKLNEPQTAEINALIELITSSTGTLQLTVAEMALGELKDGKYQLAVSRLLEEMDKLRAIHPDLYNYLIQSEKNIQNQ